VSAPPALLLFALHGFARSFGIGRMAGVSAVRQSSYTEELSFFYKNAYDDFFGKEHEFLTLDSSLPKDMQVSFLTGVQRCAGGKEREIVRKALKALVVTLVRERDDLQIENLRLQVERRASKVVLRSTCGPAPVRGRAGAVAADVRGDAGWQASQAGGRFTARGVGEELRRVKRRKGRRNLANFESQPVTTHVYELSEEERACPCCGLERKVIGSDEIWQIEYFPGHFERLRHVRKKHAGPACEHNGENRRMETAAKPRDAFEKRLAGPGLLAYIATSKFAEYCLFTDWRMFSLARASRSLAPPNRSGVAIWVICSSRCGNRWLNAYAPGTWWPPMTRSCPC
jgi:transposase